MPDVSLPTGAIRAPRGPGARGGRGFKPQGGSRGRGGPRLVAHDIEDRRKARTEDVVTSESREKTFEDLLLSSPVLQGLNNSGFVRPSPVQLQAIPKAKVGFDCIVQSKSGTGKTCVYVVTALEMVKPDLSALQVICPFLTFTSSINLEMSPGVGVGPHSRNRRPGTKSYGYSDVNRSDHSYIGVVNNAL